MGIVIPLAYVNTLSILKNVNLAIKTDEEIDNAVNSLK